MKVRHYVETIQASISQLPIELIEEVIDTLHDARLTGKQVFIMGNGGSASTASHFVCDLAKNTRKEGWPHFKAIGLADNIAIFSAYANDEGYDNVFAQQLASLICTGDIVIGISASGNSPNVLKAMEVARQHRAKTIGFTGFDGGKLGTMVDINIHIPNNNYGQVEDIHMMLEHMTVDALKERVRADMPPQKPSEVVHAELRLAEETISQLFGKPTVVFDEKSALNDTKNSLDLLYKISRELAEKLDLHTLLEQILIMTLQNTGAASGSIVVLDSEGKVIEGAMAYEGELQNQNAQQMADIVQGGLAGWVIEHRQGALISSTSEDPRWLPRAWEKGRSRSALSVPLLSQNRVVGVLTMVHPETGKFTREDLALLTAIALAVSVNGEEKLMRK
jgi:D-sedoheptulose 7-phosphate isomerase